MRYRPVSGLWFFKALAQMWAWFAWLWLAPPPSNPSPRRRLWFNLAAGAVALLTLSAGALFSIATFGPEASATPETRFRTALATFGLFGLPTSIIAVVIGALLVHARAGTDLAHTTAAILLAATFFLQWLTLAAAIWRRGRM